ncbi:MAG TPA: ABC transporter permease [Acidimicrobiia bacterium]|nr:ABC transporter permease [Acidimicrobiia bacterium]
MTAVMHASRIAGRHIRALLRQPWYIVASLTQPIIWLLLFGQLFEQVTELPGFPTDDYTAYLASGIVIMTAMFANSWNGMGLLDDMESGVLDRLLVSPLRRSAILTGVDIQQMISLTVQALILLGLAFVLGARFAGGWLGVLVLIVLSVLLGAGFGGISMATALTVRQRESVIGMNQLLVLPAMFLSTALLPASLLPGWIATVARYNPANWAAVASQEVMLESNPDWGVVATRALLLVVFAAVTVFWGTQSFQSYQKSI